MLASRLSHTSNENTVFVSDMSVPVSFQLKISEPDDHALFNAIDKIGRITGVIEISHEPNSKQLFLSLHASKTCLACVEEVLDEYRITIFQGWLQLLRNEYNRLRDRETYMDGHKIQCERHTMAQKH